MTGDELKQTLIDINMPMTALCRSLGVSNTCGYHWTSGRRPVPGYVPAWLEEKTKTIAERLQEHMDS